MAAGTRRPARRVWARHIGSPQCRPLPDAPRRDLPVNGEAGGSAAAVRIVLCPKPTCRPGRPLSLRSSRPCSFQGARWWPHGARRSRSACRRRRSRSLYEAIRALEQIRALCAFASTSPACSAIRCNDVARRQVAGSASNRLAPRLADKVARGQRGRSNRENRGTSNPMQRRCADRPVSPFRRVDEFRYHPQGALSASANRRSFSKTDERQVVLELGLEGKFAAKSTGWDEKPGLPRRGPVGDRSQGRAAGSYAMCPPGRRRPNRCCTTSPTTSDGATAAGNGVALRCHLWCRGRQRCR